MAAKVGMTLDEIKAAVTAGHTVHYGNSGSVVLLDNVGQWLILCTHNNHCIGLTWRDGVTLNGDPWHFYIAGDE